MRKPVIITGRLPTLEEIAKRSNMSPSRVAWLRRLTDKLIAETGNGRARRIAPKNARKTGAATKKKSAAKATRLKRK